MREHPGPGYPDLSSRWSAAGPRIIKRLTPEQKDAPYRLFGLRPLSPLVGAEISGIDLRAPLESAVHSELERAVLEWKVIFLRGQHLRAEQYESFGQSWGEIEVDPFSSYPEREGPSGFRLNSLAGGQNVWRTDGTWRINPVMYCMFHMIEATPDSVGDTIWADAGAAYDNLPEEVRLFVRRLEAVHDFMPSFGSQFPAGKMEEYRSRFPPVAHPIVCVHPRTLRETLFVNASYTTHIPALPLQNSEELLRFLFAQSIVPELQVRWSWRAGDVAIWDNRATWCYSASGHSSQPWTAERISIAGRPRFDDVGTPRSRSRMTEGVGMRDVCLEDNVVIRFVDSSRDHPHVSLEQVAPPLAHAAAFSSDAAMCSTGRLVVPLRMMPWSEELPGHWVKCPECLALIT